MTDLINLGRPGISNSDNSDSTEKPDKKIKPIVLGKKSKAVRILVTVLSVFVILLAVTVVFGFFFVFVPGKKLMDEVNITKVQAAELKQAVAEKDLVKTKQKITELRKQIDVVQNSYKKLALVGSLPYIKDYYHDGQVSFSIAKDGLDTGDILIQAIEPYQDFLGLKGTTKSDAGKTTEDRIAFLTQSVEGLLPHLDTIDQKVSDIETNLNQIDPNRYPDEFKGYQVKSSILQAKDMVAQAHKILRDGQPILKKTSWLLGKDKPRKYLLVYQNDAELRPSGGFWTAYATLQVSNGKVIPGTSNNIYDLDDKINSKIPAPRIISSYHIGVPYFYVRDMNLSPDFPTDAQTFLDYYYKAYGTKDKFDAVVGIDTQVLVNIVSVLGKVATPLGQFTTAPDPRCNGCPQIIYELEWMAGRPRNYIDKDRKGFLGPLMNSLLANAMGSEKSKIGPLAQNTIDSIYQKHILFYFLDPEIQKAAVLADISGAVTQTDKNIDYFGLVDANMASAKSNIFITQKIKHEITSKDGKVEHKVTITYTNPFAASNCNLEKGDLCLNASKYRDFYRFYVSQGSQLQKMTGSEVKVDPYDELGKTVFEGFYGNHYPLYAKSSVITSVQYVSSVPASSDYTLYLQKQAGTKPVDYQLIVNGKKLDNFSWVADKSIKIAL